MNQFSAVTSLRAVRALCTRGPWKSSAVVQVTGDPTRSQEGLEQVVELPRREPGLEDELDLGADGSHLAPHQAVGEQLLAALLVGGVWCDADLVPGPPGVQVDQSSWSPPRREGIRMA